MVVGEARDAIDGVHARFRLLQRLRIDVGRIDERALEQALLAQQDRERIRLLAGAAARHPHAQRRIGAQQRHDLRPQHAVVARVAEHLAHLDREVVEQHGEEGRFVQHAVLHLRQRAAAEAHHRRRHAPLQRCGRVTAEVVVVLAIDRIDEETQLQVHVAGRHRVDRIHRWRSAVGHRHFGIQTRISDRSFSTSSGFAM